MNLGRKRIDPVLGVIETVKGEVAPDIIVGDFRMLVSNSVK
jgi:hypothetical protein